MPEDKSSVSVSGWFSACCTFCGFVLRHHDDWSDQLEPYEKRQDLLGLVCCHKTWGFSSGLITDKFTDDLRLGLCCCLIAVRRRKQLDGSEVDSWPIAVQSPQISLSQNSGESPRCQCHLKPTAFGIVTDGHTRWLVVLLLGIGTINRAPFRWNKRFWHAWGVERKATSSKVLRDRQT